MVLNKAVNLGNPTVSTFQAPIVLSFLGSSVNQNSKLLTAKSNIAKFFKMQAAPSSDRNPKVATEENISSQEIGNQIYSVYNFLLLVLSINSAYLQNTVSLIPLPFLSSFSPVS